MYSKNCSGSVGAGVASTPSQREEWDAGTLHGPSELHMTKPRRWDKNDEAQSFLPPLFPPPSCFKSLRFERLAGERPIGSVPFHRADGGELLTGVEHPESREEGRRSNLAMSARLLAFARTKEKKKKEEEKPKKKELVDLVGESSAPWKVPVSFKCFCFSRWSLRFHFFCTLYLKNKKRKNKTKQNYEVTVKGTRFWRFFFQRCGWI